MRRRDSPRKSLIRFTSLSKLSTRPPRPRFTRPRSRSMSELRNSLLTRSKRSTRLRFLLIRLTLLKLLLPS